MPATTVTPIRASTQELLNIEDIQDDIVILKDGACSIILQVNAINFNLLSESEQDAIMYAYAGLLNSLTFSVQIIVRSTIKDVTDYIRLVRKQEAVQKKTLLLEQLHKYREFVENIVKENQVLDKKFYVVIPFTTLELGLVNTLASSFSKKKKLPYPKSYILERAKMNLYPKRDHLFRQFSRLGLQTRQLNTQQLLELFYSLYNQESVGVNFTTSRDYSSPMVQTSFAPHAPSEPINQKPMPTLTTEVKPQNTPIPPLPPTPPPTLHSSPLPPLQNQAIFQNPLSNPPTKPQSPVMPIQNTPQPTNPKGGDLTSGFGYDNGENS